MREAAVAALDPVELPIFTHMELNHIPSISDDLKQVKARQD